METRLEDAIQKVVAKEEEVESGLQNIFQTQLATLQKELVAQNTNINQQLINQSSENSALRANLAIRDHEIKSLKTTLKADREQIDGLTALVSEKTQKLSEVSSALEAIERVRKGEQASDETLRDMQRYLTDKDAQILGLTGQLKTQKQKYETELASHQQHKHELTQKIKVVEVEYVAKVRRLERDLRDGNQRITNLKTKLQGLAGKQQPESSHGSRHLRVEMNDIRAIVDGMLSRLLDMETASEGLQAVFETLSTLSETGRAWVSPEVPAGIVESGQAAWISDDPHSLKQLSEKREDEKNPTQQESQDVSRSVKPCQDAESSSLSELSSTPDLSQFDKGRRIIMRSPSGEDTAVPPLSIVEEQSRRRAGPTPKSILRETKVASVQFLGGSAVHVAGSLEVRDDSEDLSSTIAATTGPSQTALGLYHGNFLRDNQANKDKIQIDDPSAISFIEDIRMQLGGASMLLTPAEFQASLPRPVDQKRSASEMEETAVGAVKKLKSHAYLDGKSVGGTRVEDAVACKTGPMWKNELTSHYFHASQTLRTLPERSTSEPATTAKLGGDGKQLWQGKEQRFSHPPTFLRPAQMQTKKGGRGGSRRVYSGNRGNKRV